MPVTPTYPGVYIEEVPSGVRTITGVATSITAVIGRTRWGPVNEPVPVNSFADFERYFGGLWPESTVGFALRDFYLNGGGQALVVRLFHPDFPTEEARLAALEAATGEAQEAAEAVAEAAEDAVEGATEAEDVAAAAEAEAVAAGAAGPAAQAAADAVAGAARGAVVEGATPQDIADVAVAAVPEAVAAAAAPLAPRTRATLTVGGLSLEAADPGSWGNGMRARIDHDVRPGDDSLFNLSLRNGATGEIETIRNVSVQSNHARRVDRVLEVESRFVRTAGPLPDTRPTESGAVAAGADPFGSATSTGVLVTGEASDGDPLITADFTGSETDKTGIYAFEKADLFNLLCIPPYAPGTDVATSLWGTAAAYCLRKRAMLLVDPPEGWRSKDAARGDGVNTGVASLMSSIGTDSARNAALYFPRILAANPLREDRLDEFVPSGAVAGVIARTDGQRGVWKAPAGLDASLTGVLGLTVPLTDPENGELNPLGVNCLRARPAAGRVVWGARTLQGDDRLASEWKYVPVRRTALFIEESLYRGTQWVVFEPNDEPLWAQIRLNVGAFMHSLFRQGAFQGTTPRAAYLVKCDSETTTQDDINRGIVNILVGFAPLKPAEFVIIKIQQLAGQVDS
jgi:uncharacterized protein